MAFKRKNKRDEFSEPNQNWSRFWFLLVSVFGLIITLNLIHTIGYVPNFQLIISRLLG